MKSERLYALTIVGGKGERLKPLTNQIPKPMVKINGIPIIEHQVNWMKSQGITDVIFLCGYLGEKIQDHFGDGSKFGIRTKYYFEKSPLGRGGAIKKGMDFVPDNTNLLVTNGDIITNQEIQPIINSHIKSKVICTVMLVPYISQYGVVINDKDDYIKSFDEKGKLPYWINAGVYIMNSSIKNLLPDIGDHENTTFTSLLKEKQLFGFRSKKIWSSIESIKDLLEMEKKMKNGDLKF
ncbi:MAG: nucleotidyltransferase [Chloroflexi bacterium]|nr:nucleotidyltransferase [Chloroflexota bacterium]|tara:strand:- start:710 stop:1420 length:711 start_codon:yes stop_codon:yes gene_type:complete